MRILKISSILAGGKDETIMGLQGGSKWGEVGEGFEEILR